MSAGLLTVRLRNSSGRRRARRQSRVAPGGVGARARPGRRARARGGGRARRGASRLHGRCEGVRARRRALVGRGRPGPSPGPRSESRPHRRRGRLRRRPRPRGRPARRRHPGAGGARACGRSRRVPRRPAAGRLPEAHRGRSRDCGARSSEGRSAALLGCLRRVDRREPKGAGERCRSGFRGRRRRRRRRVHVRRRALGAFARARGGDTSDGVAPLDEAFARASTSDDAEHVLAVSLAALFLGDDDRFATLINRATSLARARGELGLLVEALGMGAVQHHLAQRFDEAALVAGEGLRFARELGASNAAARPLGILAFSAAIHGDDEEARRRAPRCASSPLRTGCPRARPGPPTCSPCSTSATGAGARPLSTLAWSPTPPGRRRQVHRQKRTAGHDRGCGARGPPGRGP